MTPARDEVHPVHTRGARDAQVRLHLSHADRVAQKYGWFFTSNAGLVRWLRVEEDDARSEAVLVLIAAVDRWHDKERAEFAALLTRAIHCRLLTMHRGEIRRQRRESMATGGYAHRWEERWEEDDFGGAEHGARLVALPWLSPSHFADPSVGVQLAELTEHLRDVPARQRLVALLAAEGYTPAEIAARTGSAPRTVHDNLLRVRQSLRRRDP